MTQQTLEPNQLPNTEGTSFPVSPTTGDRYYRTDRNLEYYYDGTRWLTTTLYKDTFEISTPQGLATTGLCWTGVWTGDYDQYLVDLYASTFVATTNTGANYWSIDLVSKNAGASSASLGAFNTSADSPNIWTVKQVAVNALLGTTEDALQITNTKVSSPGTLYASFGITYRLVG